MHDLLLSYLLRVQELQLRLKGGQLRLRQARRRRVAAAAAAARRCSERPVAREPPLRVARPCASAASVSVAPPAPPTSASCMGRLVGGPTVYAWEQDSNGRAEVTLSSGEWSGGSLCKQSLECSTPLSSSPAARQHGTREASRKSRGLGGQQVMS